MPSPLSRSRFLAAGVAAGASVAVPRLGRAQAPAQLQVTVAVDPAAAGIEVPADFLGLSFPSTSFAEQTLFNPDNPSVVALFRRLGARGVVRIGGIEVDRVVYAPPAGTGAAANAITITPSDLTRLGSFADATRWSVLYGIDLATANVTDPSREAAAAYNALLSHLLAFELGDSPDTYLARGLRAAPYGYPQYVTDFRAAADAIRLRVPSARLAGPGLSSSQWLTRFAQDERGVLLTGHWYAASAPSDPNATTAHLLAPDPAYAAFLDTLRSAANANGEAYRVSELNAVGGGGKAGVSDTFASALWALGALFTAAAAGASGVNVHAATSGPSAVLVSDANGTHEIRPLYYALLFFSLAAPQRLLALPPAPNAANLRTYITRSADGRTAAALINTDTAQDARVTIDAGRALSATTVMRLRAPSLEDRVGVELGGAAVTTGGTWTPGPAERVAPTGSTVTITVPFGSAALVTLS